MIIENDNNTAKNLTKHPQTETVGNSDSPQHYEFLDMQRILSINYFSSIFFEILFAIFPLNFPSSAAQTRVGWM